MKLRKILLLTLSALVMFILVGCSNETVDKETQTNEEPQQEFYRSIIVDEVIGEVKVLHVDGNELQAYEGMSLVDGDSVSVGDESSLVLRVDSDKNLLAEAGTKFSLDVKGTEESNQTQILLDFGSVLCEIQEKLKDDESFEVVTASSTMSVRGTVFKSSVIKSADGNVAYDVVEVFEGTVWSKLENSENDYDVVLEQGTCAAVKQATDESVAGYISGSIINEDFFKNPEDYEIVENLEEATTEVNYNHLSEKETEKLVEIIVNGRELSIKKEDLEAIRDVSNITEVENITKKTSDGGNMDVNIYKTNDGMKIGIVTYDHSNDDSSSEGQNNQTDNNPTIGSGDDKNNSPGGLTGGGTSGGLTGGGISGGLTGGGTSGGLTGGD